LQVCHEEIAIYKRISDLAKGFSGQREQAKAELLIKLAKQYKKVLAFDGTILTLDYLKKIILEKHPDIAEVYVVTGQSERMKEVIKEKFSLGAKGDQRIRRLERMDSAHKEIHAYWPNDTESFSLKGDKKLIETLIVTENLIGNNVEFPKSLYEKHLKNDTSINKWIEAYKDYNTGDYEWEGIKDSFRPIYDLIEGDNYLIGKETYEEIRKVSSSVRSRVSFVKSPMQWSFFAFRGDASKSPKWLFIDNEDKMYTDFPEICKQLRKYIQANNIVSEKWTKEKDKFLIAAVRKLKQK